VKAAHAKAIEDLNTKLFEAQDEAKAKIESVQRDVAEAANARVSAASEEKETALHQFRQQIEELRSSVAKQLADSKVELLGVEEAHAVSSALKDEEYTKAVSSLKEDFQVESEALKARHASDLEDFLTSHQSALAAHKEKDVADVASARSKHAAELEEALSNIRALEVRFTYAAEP